MKDKKTKEQEEKKQDEPKQSKKKQAKQDEGSRWAAMILLVITVVAGLVFYLVGHGLSMPEVDLSEWQWSREYVIE
jgi:hypothetical protein